jgi:bifunctional enzyme CysN/CysC/sulfate adenylyltransferase subunit 1
MQLRVLEQAKVSTGAAAEVPAQNQSLLRFTTAGSVDDGKSTLIGRLLYDSKALYEDQIASVRKSGVNRSTGPIDLSLFTDGLRAEREQGITIDVAFRYFSTPKRKFIIADTPGHEQYTRNMATGASTADAAVILIDAGKGLVPQSRRHIYISALLGIRHVIAAVNKMDLHGYSREVFRGVAEEFEDFCLRLGIPNTYVIPVSALEGENVVERGQKTDWYRGPALLELLESLPVAGTAETAALRFPVQYVIRPNAEFRGFAGRVSAGMLRRGAAVVALPSGARTKVKSITTFDGPLESAGPGSSVTVTLEDEIDLSRGDLLVTPSGIPQSSTRFNAHIVWMHADQVRPGRSFLLKHNTRTVRATISSIRHRIDVNTRAELDTTSLQMNDIAAVTIETTKPLHFDSYEQDRTMGSFILIDPIHNATMAAGMIDRKAEQESETPGSGRVLMSERAARNGHHAAAVWLVDRHDLAAALEREIFARGWNGLMVPTDVEPEQLPAIAKVLRNSGAITIFSVSAAAVHNRQEVEAVFGKDFFIGLAGVTANDGDALAMLLQHLRQLQKGDS